MKTITTGLKTFQSIQGYFISDRRMLHYINLNCHQWDRAAVYSRFSILGLTSFVPAIRINDVISRLQQEDVREGIINHDMEVHSIVARDLSFLKEAKYIISYWLCAHDLHFFPIWDRKRKLIQKWDNQQGINSYQNLKDLIDNHRDGNSGNGLDYFMWNKLLWYCE